MNAITENSRSVWMDIEVAPEAAPLGDDASSDVVIVGSGIAGLSVAYEVAKSGRSVIVLDRGAIAGGMTSRTTAHLAPICDDSLAELVEVSRGLGLPLQSLEKTPYLRYSNQAAFHPLKYLRAVADAIVANGGRLHPNSAVEAIEETDHDVTVTVAGGFTVRANHAVVATNSPVHDARLAYHTKEAPYRTYAMAFELKKGFLDDALYWDTLNPYHYVRLASGPDGKDLLIVGGEDHKSGEEDNATERFAALGAWIKTLVPELGRETHRWSGQVMDTPDYGAYIGRDGDSKRTYVATGDSGQGITHGIVASLIIPALISGAGSEFEAVYAPARTPAKAVKTRLAENLSAVRNMAEYALPGDVASIDDLKPGQGAIIRNWLEKIAAYRDEDGKIHRRSASCTHLGCRVKWNSFERCWDCPCHGSHFAPDGTVLNGPALSPLPPIAE